jgi:hypothetical protein
MKIPYFVNIEMKMQKKQTIFWLQKTLLNYGLQNKKLNNLLFEELKIIYTF